MAFYCHSFGSGINIKQGCFIDDICNYSGCSLEQFRSSNDLGTGPREQSKSSPPRFPTPGFYPGLGCQESDPDQTSLQFPKQRGRASKSLSSKAT